MDTINVTLHSKGASKKSGKLFMNLLVIISYVGTSIKVVYGAHTNPAVIDISYEVGRYPLLHTSKMEQEREGMATGQLVGKTHVVGIVLEFNTVGREGGVV